jgi:hypothetical protein
MRETRGRTALVYLNRLLTGCLTGCLVMQGGGVLPALLSLGRREYLRVHGLFTWYADIFMPLLGLGSTLTGYLRYRASGGPSDLWGTLALVAVGVTSLTINHPINERIWQLDRAASDADADIDRLKDRWLAGHLLRTVLAVVGFLILLTDSPPRGERESEPKNAPGWRRWLDLIVGLVLISSFRRTTKQAADRLKGLGSYRSDPGS